VRRLGLALLLALLPHLAMADAPAEPRYSRIAAIDWGLAETLLGIGFTPIAVGGLENYRRWVGEPVMPDSVQDLGLRTEPNLELLTQLKPDLILITPQFEAARPWLEKIAPVKSLAIYRPDSNPLLTAAEVTRELGRLTGHEAEAERLISELDQHIAAVRAQLSGRTLPPFYLVSFIDDRHVRVFGDSSLFHSVLVRVGLRNAWTGEDNYWGFNQAGIEQLTETPDAALIYFAPMPLNAERTLARSMLWQNMPFVRAQRVYAFPPAWQFGGLMSAEHFLRLLQEALPHD